MRGWLSVGIGRTCGLAVLGGVAALIACRPVPPVPLLGAGASRGANVLLITIDTLRRDRLGAYRSRLGLTPALDRLADAGVRVTHAYSHVPLTLPAHTSILTGLLPLHHRVHTNGVTRLAPDVPTLATILKGAGYRTGAFVGAFVLDARFGLSRGFDEYDDRFPRGADPTFAFAERRGDEVVRRAGDWIVSARAAAPWLAWVHLFDPHAPYDAPPDYREGRQPYDAEVAYADAMVGRLLDRLRAAGTLERTLVVVTADHGESLGEHGETTHGLFAYESTLAVPLLIAGPGIAPGSLERLTGHVDILATVLDLVGVAPPSGLDGASLAGPARPDREVYFEALDAAITRGWAPLTGIVSGQWKYIDLPESEMYDLGSDPGETRNMMGEDRARAEVLAQELRALAESGAHGSAPPLVDPEAERRLRSLGYVAAAVPSAGEPRTYTAGDDPKHLVGLNERFNDALAAFNAGRASDALAGFRAVLAERPDFLAARTSASTVLVATGHARDAVAVLRDAPSSQSESPDLLAKLGVAHREAGDLAGAARALEAARAAGAGNPEIANDLGVVYARLGRAAEARALFAELLARDPDDAVTWNNLGVLELSAERPREAAVAFRHAVDADPNRGDAWQGLGAALVSSDRAAAVDAWRRAERLRPHDYDLLFNLGVVLSEGPAPREALPYLQRFVREAPRDRYRADIARVEAIIAQVSR